MTEQSEMKINKTRIYYSVGYFILGILIICWRLRFDNLFYLKVEIDSYNYDRLWWCLASSCIGFAALAFRLRYNPKPPFPNYIYYYPFMLIVISALVFSACHLFEASSGFVFYSLSFALCVILSFLVDRFWHLCISIIERRQKGL
jgi:hypothetical protein